MRLDLHKRWVRQAQPFVRALRLAWKVGGVGAGAWNQGISAEKGPVISLRCGASATSSSPCLLPSSSSQVPWLSDVVWEPE